MDGPPRARDQAAHSRGCARARVPGTGLDTNHPAPVGGPAPHGGATAGAGEDVEGRPLGHCPWESRPVRPRRDAGGSLRQLKIALLQDPAPPLWGPCLKETKALAWKDMRAPASPAALLTAAKARGPPKCPRQTIKPRRPEISTPTTEHRSAVNKNSSWVDALCLVKRVR